MHDHQVAHNIPTASRRTRQDNKVRLSQDVLEKADRIAAEWGLKNARAAVEAVFRRYCDDYLYGRPADMGESFVAHESPPQRYGASLPAPDRRSPPPSPKCEALDALDQLLAL
ncbi:hypothetical protein IQ273_14910 [Nodosilinea sp. LEGE 07298]|uniref:hypothetical protein n=1 Tax=Nodosilinea sp. LEGE 07298 TaxID=2777970 RepID=UPI0018816E9A|nr:hypothetical protein [Nodosilinea sp. LEGE 07298]MBE9110709.1 hypothetical protein [Nodosilinea sp. LEGE 07298]